MKNTFKILALSLVTLFTFSCAKDDVGGTATESMAGEWIITSVEIYDTEGNFYYDDCEYYDCTFTIQTFNTAANVATEMWLYDAYSYWSFQVKVNIDQSSKTFSVDQGASSVFWDYYYEDDDVDEEYPIAYYYDCEVTVTDGAIITDGATSPTGMPTDAIEFTAEFSDDPGYLYKFSGYRYSGFE